MRLVYKDLGDGTSLKYIMDVNDRPLAANIEPTDTEVCAMPYLPEFINYLAVDDERLTVERNIELTVSDETVLF